MDVGRLRKRAIREVRFIEDLISERHMECLVPVYHGITPDSEDIPDTLRYSCAMPANNAIEFIRAEDKNYDYILSKVSGNYTCYPAV